MRFSFNFQYYASIDFSYTIFHFNDLSEDIAILNSSIVSFSFVHMLVGWMYHDDDGEQNTEGVLDIRYLLTIFL